MRRTRRVVLPAWGPVVVVGGGGFYSSARYQPRYPLPAGVTISPVTGLSTGYPTGMTGAADTSSSNVVTLTDQGSISANRTALQSAIDATVSGAVGTETTIVLPTVTTDWGDEINIPTATWGGRGLTIMAASVPRATGKRVQDSDLAGMTKFVLRPSNAWSAPGYGGDRAFRTIFRIQNNAANVQIVGLYFTADPTDSYLANTVLTAPSNERLGGAGYVYAGGDTAATFADRITIDRCLFAGVDDRPVHKGCVLNGSRLTVVNCRFVHFHMRHFDSYCLLIGSGGFGHVIENNYFGSAYGECCFIGATKEPDGEHDGSGNPILANIANNIVVRRNFMEFRDEYQSRGYLHKNLFESKGGRTALFEANLCRGFRSLSTGVMGGQFFALAFKYSSSAGHQWTVRLNKVYDSNAGFCLVEGMGNFEAQHNIYDRTGIANTSNAKNYLMQVSQVTVATLARQPDGFTLRYNTFDGPCGPDDEFRRWIYDAVGDGVTRTNWSIENNIVYLQDTVDIPGNFSTWYVHGYYGTDAITSNAKSAWDGQTKSGCTFENNHVAGLLSAQFSRAITGDFVFQRKSDLNIGSDFAPLGAPTAGFGCDVALLNTALSGVETGL